MLMLDLCCGLKGASAAMSARGWDVVTLDINEKFEPDIIADITAWTWQGKKPDLVWCSPPCTEYSRTALPWIKDKKQPDMSIFLSCVRLIDQIRPRYWVIENVQGAVSWFTPHLGRPRYVCFPYYLWGFFPDISHIRVKSNKEKITSNRSALRALIPYKISNGLAVAIEESLAFEEVLA